MHLLLVETKVFNNPCVLKGARSQHLHSQIQGINDWIHASKAVTTLSILL